MTPSTNFPTNLLIIRLPSYLRTPTCFPYPSTDTPAYSPHNARRLIYLLIDFLNYLFTNSLAYKPTSSYLTHLHTHLPINSHAEYLPTTHQPSSNLLIIHQPSRLDVAACFLCLPTTYRPTYPTTRAPNDFLSYSHTYLELVSNLLTHLSTYLRTYPSTDVSAYRPPTFQHT